MITYGEQVIPWSMNEAQQLANLKIATYTPTNACYHCNTKLRFVSNKKCVRCFERKPD